MHIDIEMDSDELILYLEIIDGILLDGNASKAYQSCLQLGSL